MSHKSLLLTFVALLLIGGGFFFWQRTHPAIAPVSPPVVTEPTVESAKPTDTPIDTSDWQTYRNEELGIEFKYPKEYVVFDDYGDNKTLFVSFPKNKIHRVNGIFFRLGDTVTSPEKLLEQIRRDSEVWGSERLLSDETVKIGNGITARKIVHMNEIGYNPEHYFIIHQNQFVEMEIRIEIPYIKEILATLHFFK